MRSNPDGLCFWVFFVVVGFSRGYIILLRARGHAQSEFQEQWTLAEPHLSQGTEGKIVRPTGVSDRVYAGVV